jgi:hypothetical protein
VRTVFMPRSSFCWQFCQEEKSVTHSYEWYVSGFIQCRGTGHVHLRLMRWLGRQQCDDTASRGAYCVKVWRPVWHQRYR